MHRDFGPARIIPMKAVTVVLTHTVTLPAALGVTDTGSTFDHFALYHIQFSALLSKAT